MSALHHCRCVVYLLSLTSPMLSCVCDVAAGRYQGQRFSGRDPRRNHTHTHPGRAHLFSVWMPLYFTPPAPRRHPAPSCVRRTANHVILSSHRPSSRCPETCGSGAKSGLCALQICDFGTKMLKLQQGWPGNADSSSDWCTVPQCDASAETFSIQSLSEETHLSDCCLLG